MGQVQVNAAQKSLNEREEMENTKTKKWIKQCEQEQEVKASTNVSSSMDGNAHLKAYSLMLNRGRSQNVQNLIFLHIFVAHL